MGAIAETALNSTDWDPSLAFVTAKNFAFALQQTRRLIRNRGYTQHFPVDVLLPALTAGDIKPRAAASLVLGVPVVPDPPAKHVPVAASVMGRSADKGSTSDSEEND